MKILVVFTGLVFIMNREQFLSITVRLLKTLSTTEVVLEFIMKDYSQFQAVRLRSTMLLRLAKQEVFINRFNETHVCLRLSPGFIIPSLQPIFHVEIRIVIFQVQVFFHGEIILLEI